MDVERDLARLALQEQRLVFPAFDLEAAWTLGTRLRDLARERGLALAIEVRVAAQTVFFAAMPGTAPANHDWVRRKRNTTELLGRSSYRVGLELQRSGQSLETSMGLPARDYASHGGSFPLRLLELGSIGSVTVSGAPQREDHQLVTRALADALAIAWGEIALDPEAG
jgi:uncharacterized protein (UPF0303 family)